MAIINDVREVIIQAGELALEYFKQLDTLGIEKKSPKDLVSQADIEVEKFLKDQLLERFPDFGFWGEESGQSDNQKIRWIVDPIDGTHSFVRGQYFWSISVALEKDGEIVLGAVYAPKLQDLYHAEKGKGALRNNNPIHVSDIPTLSEAMITTGFACLRSDLPENNLPRFSRIAETTMGQRRFGSAAMDLCLVADGQVDAFWEQHLNLYDIAAGALIVKEAGGSITNFEGKDGIFPENILATNGKILKEILPLM